MKKQVVLYDPVFAERQLIEHADRFPEIEELSDSKICDLITLLSYDIELLQCQLAVQESRKSRCVNFLKRRAIYRNRPAL